MLKQKSLRKKLGKIRGLILEVQKDSREVTCPNYESVHDVGLDIRANEDVSLMPLEQKSVKTGISIKIPEDHVGLIRDRSGMVSEMNVHTVAGTFDPSNLGEVLITLVNFGEEEVEIEKGMKIAQLIILPIVKPKIRIVKNLEKPSPKIKAKLKAFKELEKELEEEND